MALTLTAPRTAPPGAGVGSAPPQGLPSPPTDDEKLSYLKGPVWVVLAQTVAAAAIVISVVWFSLGVPGAEWALVPAIFLGAWSTISTFIGLHPRRVSARKHARTRAEGAPLARSTIDVFLPSAGEPLELLENTYTHVAALEWDGPITVLVLDDSARDEVRALAERFGFQYLVRPNRPHLKKAGNLKHGYEHSSGAFIVILDADFVPRPDFLHELIPYFMDERVGIVQSPQYFDVGTDMNWLERAAGATQMYFYRWVQPARDRLGAAICVGTCAIYRRGGLERSGGFAQIGHSEDVHTGVNLLKVGFQLRYVPLVLAKGVCPDNMSGFINQQYRWCAGSMSLLRDPAFHRMKLGFRRRLCFWSGFFYYLTTALLVFMAPLPTVHVLWFHPERVRIENYALITSALFMWFAIVPTVTSGKGRRMDLARLGMVYSFAHARAVFDTFVLGRTAAWSPTGAAKKSTMVDSVLFMMQTWLILSQVLILVGVARMVPAYGIGTTWPAVLYSGLAWFTVAPIVRDVFVAKAAEEARP